MEDDSLKIVTGNGLMSINTGILAQDVGVGTSTITVANSTLSNTRSYVDVTDVLDEFHMNRFAVDHKVTAQELLKLKEVAPDYANEIKENIARNLARDIAKKISYTKKHDKDADVHHFIGRVWVFTEDELKAILEKR